MQKKRCLSTIKSSYKVSAVIPCQCPRGSQPSFPSNLPPAPHKKTQTGIARSKIKDRKRYKTCVAFLHSARKCNVPIFFAYISHPCREKINEKRQKLQSDVIIEVHFIFNAGKKRSSITKVSQQKCKQTNKQKILINYRDFPMASIAREIIQRKGDENVVISLLSSCSPYKTVRVTSSRTLGLICGSSRPSA